MAVDIRRLLLRLSHFRPVSFLSCLDGHIFESGLNSTFTEQRMHLWLSQGLFPRRRQRHLMFGIGSDSRSHVHWGSVIPAVDWHKQLRFVLLPECHAFIFLPLLSLGLEPQKCLLSLLFFVVLLVHNPLQHLRVLRLVTLLPYLRFSGKLILPQIVLVALYIWVLQGFTICDWRLVSQALSHQISGNGFLPDNEGTAGDRMHPRLYYGLRECPMLRIICSRLWWCWLCHRPMLMHNRQHVARVEDNHLLRCRATCECILAGRMRFCFDRHCFQHFDLHISELYLLAILLHGPLILHAPPTKK